LNLIGDSWPYKQRYLGQYPLAIRRWFTPMLLHLGFSHLVMNMISQLIFGSMLESLLGFYRMAVLYIIGGFGGNLMSCVTNPEKRAVGASTADFAIIGGILGAVIVHWKVFDANPMVRCYLIFMIVIMVFFNLTMNILD
jgi:rhomboid protease GluP